MRSYTSGVIMSPVIHIHKFPMLGNYITIPGGLRVLCVQLQRGVPTVWAEVGADDACSVEVRAIPTGSSQPPQDGRYVSTIVSSEGGLVFHFYAVGEDHEG